MSLVYGTSSDLKILDELGVTDPNFDPPAPQNTARFVDAETLFYSKQRTFKGDFCYPFIWAPGRTMDQARYAAVYSNGFYALFISHILTAVNTFINDHSFSDTQTNAEWAQEHDIKIIIRAPSTGSMLRRNSSSQWPCFESDGSHIGSGVPCEDAVGYEELFSPEDYRFFDADGVKRDPQLWIEDIFLYPLLPIWKDSPIMQMIRDETLYGGDHLWGKESVETLLAAGLDVIGYSADWEDTPTTFRSGDGDLLSDGLSSSELFTSDPRFVSETAFSEANVYNVNRGITQFFEARCKTLDEIYEDFDFDPKFCHVYDILPQLPSYYIEGNTKATSFFGRKQCNFSTYPYYSRAAGLKSLLHQNSAWIARLLKWDIHVFSHWSSGNGIDEFLDYSTNPVPVDATLEERDDPEANGYDALLTVGEYIGFVRWGISVGAVAQVIYQFPSAISHPVYGMLIALDEMQPLYPFVRYGKNWLPPLRSARRINESEVHINIRSQFANQYTIFYGRDADGNEIDDTIWINCRIWDNKMMFFGITTDYSYETVDVIGPHGKRVTVAACHMGAVTIV